ncbi:MAG: AraC family transcriptional regulator [Oscillospiraceae bacterium]
MTRAFTQRTAALLTDSTDTDHANDLLLHHAKAYIKAHHAEKLTLQQVADHCGVSQWHLSKMLNRHSEKNFYDLLNSARLQKAKELMEDPAMHLSEVSAQVGYTDTAHFSRVFKRLEGITPCEYRNRHSGTN